MVHLLRWTTVEEEMNVRHQEMKSPLEPIQKKKLVSMTLCVQIILEIC